MKYRASVMVAAKVTMWTQFRAGPSAMRVPVEQRAPQLQHDEHGVDDAWGGFRSATRRRPGPDDTAIVAATSVAHTPTHEMVIRDGMTTSVGSAV
jgi:hypothetical protein